jgi:hypothetical protein
MLIIGFLFVVALLIWTSILLGKTRFYWLPATLFGALGIINIVWVAYFATDGLEGLLLIILGFPWVFIVLAFDSYMPGELFRFIFSACLPMIVNTLLLFWLGRSKYRTHTSKVRSA